MIRGRISSDADILNTLHASYPWIPSSQQIRPSKQLIEEKNRKSKQLLLEWMTCKDFVLDAYFGYPTAVYRERLYVHGPISSSDWSFFPCPFPYSLDVGYHFVLWNSYYDITVEFDNELINRQISESIQKIVGTVSFDFAWYKNPKPSIPELYHVQVFWTST